MEISCADCGCLVDRGEIVLPCADHPNCCCGHLETRSEANEDEQSRHRPGQP